LVWPRSTETHELNNTYLTEKIKTSQEQPDTLVLMPTLALSSGKNSTIILWNLYVTDTEGPMIKVVVLVIFVKEIYRVIALYAIREFTVLLCLYREFVVGQILCWVTGFVG